MFIYRRPNTVQGIGRFSKINTEVNHRTKVSWTPSRNSSAVSRKFNVLCVFLGCVQPYLFMRSKPWSESRAPKRLRRLLYGYSVKVIFFTAGSSP